MNNRECHWGALLELALRTDDGGLAATHSENNTVMIDATYLKVHRLSVQSQ
tara:strand:+ start:358 stop:510 length:153 start_codon:yes stop_codon:yes gene_type:complete